MFFFDPTYMLFMAPAFLLMLLTSWYVRSAYNKWSRVGSASHLTGLEAARRLISSGGLYGVNIEGVGGQLSDHYDPRTKTLRLSQGVANNASVAAVAIAAHELGHAMQDAEDYLPLRFRAALVPAVNVGSYHGGSLPANGQPGLAGCAGIFRRRALRPGNPAGGTERLGSRQAVAG